LLRETKIKLAVSVISCQYYRCRYRGGSDKLGVKRTSRKQLT